MKQKLLNLKSWLLMVLMMVGVNAWAAPGDEIKSPSDVVSGKSYYIKGVYTASKKDYTVYYGPTETDQKNQKVQSAPVTELDKAMPITFTKVTGGWTLTTPNGNYIRPHSSNGQTYFVEDEIVLQLKSGDTKEGTGKGIKIGSWTPSGSSDEWYIQSNKTSAKIGAYKNSQYDVTLIEAEETSGKTTTSLSFGEGSPFTVNIGESFTAPTLTATPSSILSSVTYSSSNTSVAEVNSTTGAVTIKGLGSTTIKAKYDGDDDYLASTAEYVIKVVDPDAITATFDLSANKYGWDATNDGNVYFDGSTYNPATEDDITLSVFGNVRMWGTTSSSLRLYGDNAGTEPNIYSYGRGSITLKAAEGYVITSVTFEGSNLTFEEPEVGTYTNPTWAGETNEITLVKGSNTPQIKAINVIYKAKAAAPTYGVTILTGEIENGTVTADKATAAEGETVTLTITPDEGYTLAQLMVSTVDDDEVEVEDNAFVMPASAVEVYAYFAAIPTKTYTLSELAEADIEPYSLVSVSFDNEIVDIQMDEEEGGYVALKDGDNTFVLQTYYPCNTEWAIGGTLAGTWDNVYYAEQNGAFILMNDSDDPWEGLEYTAPAPAVPTFASLADLIAADQSYDAVNVTINDEIFIAALEDGGKDKYCVMLKNSEVFLIAPAPAEGLNWLAGGTVTGTLTNVQWNGRTLSSKNADMWSQLNYDAPEVTVYESLEELINAGIGMGTTVSVKIDNEIHETQYDDEQGAYYVGLVDSEGHQVIVAGHAVSDYGWEKGGILKGTLTNVMYMILDGTYRLMGTAGYIFDDLEYTAPAPAGPTKGTINLVAEGRMPYPGYEDFPLYFATFSSDKDVIIEGGYDLDLMGVYTVGIEDGVVTPVEPEDISMAAVTDEDIMAEDGYVMGYYVPANTGVLVVSMGNEATCYYVTESESNVLADIDPDGINMLRAASVAKETDGSYKFYKLAYGDEAFTPSTLGFYWGAANGGAFDSREGSAYLAVPADAALAKGFRFVADDSATAIKNVDNKVQTNAVYNLAGQRVASKNFKGIVIKNGKKMLNK